MFKRWLEGNAQTAKKSSYIWNTIAAGFNAGQSAIVLIFVTRVFGLEMAGIVTIGYAFANLFHVIGRYGIRNYQVTDIRERFGFSDYFYSRVVSVFMTLLIAVAYLGFCLGFGEYSLEKTIIVLEVIVLKLINAFADVYIGRYQQKGRFDIGSKIHAMEEIFSTFLICLLIFLKVNLYISFFAGIIVEAGVDVILIRMTKDIVDGTIREFCASKVLDLLKIGIPLCLGLTLYTYIGNAPKYLLDIYMDEESQAIFGYVMMPMFVITLLNNFLLQPVVKDLGEVWDQKDFVKFERMILRHSLVIIGLAVVVLIVGVFIGLPLLSLFYGVSLTGYQVEFCILMVGGAFYTISYYLTVVLTTIRKQNMIIIGYLFSVLIYIILGKMMIQTYGMLGASELYLIANIITAILFIGFCLYGMYKEEHLMKGQMGNETS